MKKTIYNYHPETAEFIGASQADQSPLEPDVWLIPAHATEIEPPATQNGQRAVFNVDAQAWLVVDQPEPDPAQIKNDMWARIKSKRDATKVGGVKVGTKCYHTDTESRIQHLGLLEKARAARASGGTDATRLQALGQDIKWKTMDGSFIYLTVKHAEDIFAAVTDLDAAAFAAAETHRVAMEASADPAAYDFSVGWPATFAG